MKMLQVISAKQLNDVGGGKFTVTIANPIAVQYAGLPAPGTVLPGAQGSEVVLCVTTTGGIEARPKGTAGSWESCTKSNGLLVFSPFSEGTFVIPFAVGA